MFKIVFKGFLINNPQPEADHFFSGLFAPVHPGPGTFAAMFAMLGGQAGVFRAVMPVCGFRHTLK
jgi:hypothetical protein